MKKAKGKQPVVETTLAHLRGESDVLSRLINEKTVLAEEKRRSGASDGADRLDIEVNSLRVVREAVVRAIGKLERRTVRAVA